jgi:SAM-dependent methyltransferase
MLIQQKIGNRIQPYLNRLRFKHNSGFCNICERHTIFFEFSDWLRDNYKCQYCGSIPRNRALVNALDTFYPDWRELNIHESSPGGPVSVFLSKKAKHYSSSHYYEDVPRGSYQGTHRSEDLTQLTFNDKEFDVFITSDVFEHVFNPGKAFEEIARVLKPGGAHIFTMPWYPGLKHSLERAELKNGEIVYLQEAVYHGNPIDNSGSLVTRDWGADFCDYIYNASELYTTVYLKKDRKLGLEAELLEVFISRKQSWLQNGI